MDGRTEKFLLASRRMIDWSIKTPSIVPPKVGTPDRWAPLTRELNSLELIVAVLEESATEQHVMAKRTTLEAAGERVLWNALRMELRETTGIAQSLRNRVSGIGILAMPARNISHESFLAQADAVARNASAFEAVLIAHGRPADFIRRISAGTSALRKSMTSRGIARTQLVSATERVASALAQAKESIGIMDASITAALRDKPAELAGWKNARRVTLKGVQSGGQNVKGPTLVVSDDVAAVSEVKAA